ncbi:putative membrane protein [Pseudomonas seleniipraecipitans]|uniref:Putative membrane protein n=2 Tax=Phytopseudomonas seleniipraecipitans TaxID=640205 RepID=A0A1G7SH74_9GAMM|nr:putative membrane protein [Pseudomonas seleniipraecipitans]
MPSNQRSSITTWLQCVFLGVFLWLGWDPVDRKTWMIENSLVVVGALAVWFTRHRFYWTPRSWALVVLFLCLHQVGTHYTYPGVPYVAAIENLTGLNIEQLFGWQRNHYDRFVHLGYGVLVVLPIREIITRECQLKGAWASLIAWSFVLSTSMLYELMEWIGAQYVGGAHSVFVGAQGDIWDAQKDMAAAAGGALLVLVCRGHSLWARLGVRP